MNVSCWGVDGAYHLSEMLRFLCLLVGPGWEISRRRHRADGVARLEGKGGREGRIGYYSLFIDFGYAPTRLHGIILPRGLTYILHLLHGAQMMNQEG